MTATKEARDAAEQYINDLERRLKEVEDAALAVCLAEDLINHNEHDLYEAIDRLREVLGPEQPMGDEPAQ